jgi:hypothetical protein
MTLKELLDAICSNYGADILSAGYESNEEKYRENMEKIRNKEILIETPQGHLFGVKKVLKNPGTAALVIKCER